ncbi:MAG: BamA/TamA family outer membrane protein [Candidatus Kapaibacterium sp.]
MIKKTILIALILILTGNTGLLAQFGKNKVQYHDFDWKYIESKHFTLYYDAGSRYLAKFAAIEGEKALASIQSTLNYSINDKVPVIVYESHNDFQQTNVIGQFMPEGVGGVTELFKNRVVLPFQGDYEQFRHVIHHELVHAVLNDMFYGGSFQSALTMSGGFSIPLWMNEGFAEWESIGGMNTETDMFMRDLAISEELPSLNRLNGYLAYRGGQTFYWYVADKFGNRKVGELINKLKIFRDVDAAFKATFGKDLDDFSEEWEKDLKKYYWPDLEEFESLEEFATRITDHEEQNNFYNTSPAIAPDGTQFAYIKDDKGVFAIFVQRIDEDPDDAKKVVSSFRQQDFEDLNILTPGISWNPQSTKLAISAKSGGEDAVFITDVESGDYEKLTWGLKSITSVVWSPDGKKLAFIGSEYDKSDIYVYDFDAEELTNLTRDIFSDLNPAWSPDSKEIFFISDRLEKTEANKYTDKNYGMWYHNFEYSDIYKINIESKKIERITNDPEYIKTSIAIGPFGDQILYASDKNGIGNVYLMDLVSGNTKPITNSIAGITQITLSKDGSNLLFTAQNSGAFDIFQLRFPLEKELNIDELPLTKFRKKQKKDIEVRDVISEVDLANKEEARLKGYGDFDVEFSRQKLIEPNDDAANPEINRAEDKDVSEIDTSFTEKDYKITFTPDIIAGNPGFSTYYGFQGMTQLLFSDVLGDHQIYAQANLFLDLRNSQFMIAYSYLPKVIDYQFMGYHTSFFHLDRNAGPEDYFFRFRNFGLGAMAYYPLDLFNRFEFGADFMYLSKENVTNPEMQSVTRTMIVPRARYVHDDVLWGYFGPRKGQRYFIGFKGTPDIFSNDISFVTFDMDYRFYQPLGSNMSLALRGRGGGSFGPDAQRFFLGGTENWIDVELQDGELPFEDPEDFAFMNFEMPLRGWPVGRLTGTKFFVTNFEFRFPFLFALMAGPLPLPLQGVMGSVFFDMGGAWDDDFVSVTRNEQDELMANNLLMSAGLGIRTYVLQFPLKVDIAWRNHYSKWSDPVWMFSLGYDF